MMKKIKKPFLSVVIPTRQRHETLPYAIRTILEQDFNDYEIVVCDNNSSPETKEAVDKLNSSKIKYIRSDVDLSMSENWNLALSYAKGEYVTVIADNDGFIMGALKFLKKFIEKNSHPKLISMRNNLFYWPSVSKVGFKSVMSIYTSSDARYINGLDIIKETLKKPAEYPIYLPMVYNSIVHCSLIKKIKKTKRLFTDIYLIYTVVSH